MPVWIGANRAVRLRPWPWTTKTPSISGLGLPGKGVGAAELLPFVGWSRSDLGRTVSAWIGMARMLCLLAVVILAVAESPGRRLSGGLSRVTTTLKSFA